MRGSFVTTVYPPEVAALPLPFHPDCASDSCVAWVVSRMSFYVAYIRSQRDTTLVIRDIVFLDLAYNGRSIFSGCTQYSSHRSGCSCLRPGLVIIIHVVIMAHLAQIVSLFPQGAEHKVMNLAIAVLLLQLMDSALLQCRTIVLIVEVLAAARTLRVKVVNMSVAVFMVRILLILAERAPVDGLVVIVGRPRTFEFRSASGLHGVAVLDVSLLFDYRTEAVHRAERALQSPLFPHDCAHGLFETPALLPLVGGLVFGRAIQQLLFRDLR